MSKIVYRQDFSSSNLTVQEWPETLPNDAARFAMAMIERWGLVTGKIDGEDSAGRAVLTPAPIGEIVDRAFDLAEATYAAIERRQLSTKLLDYDAALDMAREARGKN